MVHMPAFQINCKFSAIGTMNRHGLQDILSAIRHVLLSAHNYRITSAHVSGCARRLRQRSSPHTPCVPPLATEPSRRLLHLFGIVCWRQ